MANMCRVLSIDGGGLRGIIPAMVLRELEKRTGKPVCELFDLIAGTSTGGILALALTTPDGDGRPKYSAADLIEMYELEGPDIFDRSPWTILVSGAGVLDERYSNKNLRASLEKRVNDLHLSDAMTDVLIPAYEIESRASWFFDNRTAMSDPSKNYRMVDVALATSAAPTYFEPYRIETPTDPVHYRAFVDGGVFANNPAMCALVEAKKIHSECEDFLLVSLGTGQLTRRIPWEIAKDWGLMGWARPLIGLVFDGIDDSVDYQLKRLMPDCQGRCRYFRFQTKLDTGSDDLDDSSRTNIRVLKLKAEEMISTEMHHLEELIAELEVAAMPVT